MRLWHPLNEEPIKFEGHITETNKVYRVLDDKLTYLEEHSHIPLCHAMLNNKEVTNEISIISGTKLK